MNEPQDSVIEPLVSNSQELPGSAGGSAEGSSTSHGTLRDSSTHIRGDNDIISQAIKSCDNVLKYYKWLTILLGWRMFTCRAVCSVLTAFWIILIVTTAVFQILICFRQEGVTNDHAVSYDVTVNSNSSGIIYHCGSHLISVHIIIDLIHLGIYCYCLYLFSVTDDEDSSHLVKEVYLKVALTEYGLERAPDIAEMKPVKKLIRALRAFLLFGCLWIGLSAILRIVFSISTGLFTPSTEIHWDTLYPLVIKGTVLVVLVCLSLVGFIFFDVVYVAAVMNYATQSEFIITLLSAIRNLVKNKRYQSSHPLYEAEKDIVKCQTYLKILNRRPATAAALVIFNIGVQFLAGMIAVNHADSDLWDYTENWQKYAKITTEVLNNILLLTLFAFPFIQAARVTRGCSRLKKMGTSIKNSQLYENTNKYDKDSYLSFTRAIQIKAKLFGVPIYPWFMYAALTIFCFTALTLWQTGVYSFSHYL